MLVAHNKLLIESDHVSCVASQVVSVGAPGALQQGFGVAGVFALDTVVPRTNEALFGFVTETVDVVELSTATK